MLEWLATWWRSRRAAALLRAAQPRFDEVRTDRSSPQDAGQPTALDALQAFVRESYGPDAVLLRLRKLSVDESELVIDVEHRERTLRVRRLGRKWTKAG